MTEAGSPAFDAVVAEALAWEVPLPAPRSVALAYRLGTADALIGLRRIGKTWRMFQQIHALREQGIAPDHILYLNLEDDRLRPYREGDLSRLLEAWQRCVPHLEPRAAHLFLDEVQVVPAWESFVRRLTERREMHVTVSGSSAKLLSGELATALRGRSHEVRLFPFAYREWHAFHQRSDDCFAEYLRVGGLPETFTLPPVEHRRHLQEQAQMVVLRDVAERHRLNNLPVMEAFAEQLLANTARLFSVHRLYNELMSRGHRVGKDSVYAWFAHLQEACLIEALPIASRSPRTQRVNPVKVYVADTGLAPAFSRAGVHDTGHLLETAVFWELRRRGLECAYVRTRDGKEVDFMATTPEGKRALVQACADWSDRTTQDRELAALHAAMEELYIDRAVVITLAHRETIPARDGLIEIVPAHEWFPEEGE